MSAVVSGSSEERWSTNAVTLQSPAMIATIIIRFAVKARGIDAELSSLVDAAFFYSLAVGTDPLGSS